MQPSTLCTKILGILNGTALEGFNDAQHFDGATRAIDSHLGTRRRVGPLLRSTSQPNAAPGRRAFAAPSQPKRSSDGWQRPADGPQSLILEVGESILESIRLRSRCQFVHERLASKRIGGCGQSTIGTFAQRRF